MLLQTLQNYTRTFGYTWRTLQILGWQGASLFSASQERREKSASSVPADRLHPSQVLAVRVRCTRGLYLAAVPGPELGRDERCLRALKRQRGAVNSTVLLLHLPEVAEGPWKLTDLQGRILRIEAAVESTVPQGANDDEAACPQHLSVAFEAGGTDAQRAVVYIRVGARYLSANPRSGSVVADKVHAKRWECFQLELLPTFGIERSLTLTCRFAAFIRTRNYYGRDTGWLWCGVLFTGQLVALPWHHEHRAKRSSQSVQPSPFFFEYADMSRTALIRDVSGRYLLATHDCGKHVIAHSNLPHAAEYFVVRAYPRNIIQLESRWGFLCADQSRMGPSGFFSVRCDRKQAGPWETFQIIPVMYTGSLADWWQSQLELEDAACERRLQTLDSLEIDTVIELSEGTHRRVRASASVPGVSESVAFQTVTDYEHYGKFCRGVEQCRIVESHQGEHGRISLIRTTQSRSLWIFTVKAKMLLRAEEYPSRGAVNFVFISGQGVRRYAANWEIRPVSEVGAAATAAAAAAAPQQQQRPACYMSLTIDFQPVVYIPKKWLDAMAVNAARDAFKDMMLESSARMRARN